MIVFTKQELESLHTALYTIERYSQLDKPSELLSKLTFHILNYCEHEWSSRIHLITGRKVVMCGICDKCEEISE